MDSLATLDPSVPQRFADGTADAVFTRLRREAPVHYCPASAFGPFWSISRYEDIAAIEGQPMLLQQLKFVAPIVQTQPRPDALTGRVALYSPFLGKELLYGCALHEVQP